MIEISKIEESSRRLSAGSAVITTALTMQRPLLTENSIIAARREALR